MPRRAPQASLAIALFAAGSLLAGNPRLPALERLARDPSPAVRLEAIRALAKIPEARSAEIALSVLDQPMDPTLDYALWLTINEISTPWIEALESGAWKTEGRERQLEFALKAIPPSQASRVLSRLLESRPLDPAGSGPWIEIIGQAGGPAELRKLLNTVTAGTFQPAAAQRAIRSLMDAQRLRKIRTEGDAAAIPALLQNPEAGIRESSATWAGLLKDAGRVAQLGQLAGGDPSAPVRQACFQALRQIGGAPVITLLRTQATQGPAENRGEAVAALAALDPSAALEPTLALLPGIQDENAALALFRGLLSQKGFAKSLAGALDARPQTTGARFLPENVARAGMRVAREGGRNEMELVVALAKAAGLAPDAQSFTAGLIKDLAAKAAQSGDPARGEMIYRRDSLACTACHAIGGAGGKVGPDMTSIGASAPADYLVESVLLPNSKIKEGYHSLVLTLKDGTEYVGTLARETPQEIILRNAAGAEQTVPKTDVAKREQGTSSLMPAGLIDALPEQEQLDLFAFLSRLGKQGDYDASKGGVARRWRLAQLVHTDAQSGQEGWPFTKPFTDRRWLATYALVRGSLTKASIEEVSKGNPWTGRLAVYAVTEVQVAVAGPVRFQLAAGPGAELWVGDRKAGGTGASTINLTPGRHRVLVKLDPKQVPDALRLESTDATFILD